MAEKSYVQHEYHLQVKRTARYFTLGTASEKISHVWFVCHGYGQLASDFLDSFKILARADILIVAPEGLSRFYIDASHKKTGSSWMTREDRENEIRDYKNYLQTLYKNILQSLRPRVKITLLGFSQGVATVARWINMEAIHADRLILWAGTVPPDFARARLGKQKITLVSGERDRIIPKTLMRQEADRFLQQGIKCSLIEYSGGHKIAPQILHAIDKAED